MTGNIIEAMNYRFDNPESGVLVDVDSKIIEAATKSVNDSKTWEDLALFVSMSSDKNSMQAFKIASNQTKMYLERDKDILDLSENLITKTI